MKIEIKHRYEGNVLFSFETDSMKVALEAGVKSGANLDGANLYGANLVRANLDGANLYGANLDGANLDGANLDGAKISPSTRIETGETWKEYLEQVLPALLTAGGKALSDVVTKENWDCHTWDNCPMASAFASKDINGVPILLRPRANQFIKFFDAKLIPMEAIGQKVK